MRAALLFALGLQLLAHESDSLNLLDDLSTVSEIATRTKLNIDKTPAIVSVLHSIQLKKLGIVNLYEALETVPGVEISLGTAGAKQINMRGNKSLIRDKLKLMIDGVSVNSELSGSIFSYLDMPIEIIERIEVIRGPSSALYGSFAHTGTINVVTKNSNEKNGLLFVKKSSKGLTQTGFSHNMHFDNLHISVDGFYVDNQNSLEYGPYSSITSQTTFTSYEDFSNKSLAAKIKFGDNFSFKTRWLELDSQNFFGYGDWPINRDPKRLKTTSFINELEYELKLNNNLLLNTILGYKQYTFGGTARAIPYTVLLPATKDQIVKGRHKEDNLYSDITLDYSLDNHDMIFGTYLSKSEKIKADYAINDLTSEKIYIPIENFTKNISRKQYAFYIHDIYTLSKKWTLNVGGRYDYYSDADSNFAPKVAILYQHNESENYKLIYQRSFRVPSWVELYGIEKPFLGNPSLNTEIIDTIELAYGHTSSFDNRFNINIYYSNMKDFVNRNGSFEFYNDKDINSYGLEVEWHYPLNETMYLQSNYSYIYAKIDQGSKLPFVASHLGNIMFFKQFSRNLNSGTTIRYVGERYREREDNRDDLDGYIRVNQALTYSYKSFSINATVKNLFNDDIRYSYKIGNPPFSGTYINDLPRGGRSFWLSAEWKLP